MSRLAVRCAPAAAVRRLHDAVRCVFLGSNRDYLVELADGSQVKVTAEPRVIFPPGSEVILRSPPERWPGARYVTGQTLHVNGGAYLG